MKKEINIWKWAYFGAVIIITCFILSLGIIYDTIIPKYFAGKITDIENDSAVIDIANKCQENKTKIECVYDNIPFIWEDRSSLTGKDIISPSEMIKNSGRGLCRDITLFRGAVFNRLGIYYYLSITPTHIFLYADENGTRYELNNQYLFKLEKIK